MSKKTGRPLKFATPEDMQVEIDKYFSLCEEKNQPSTITGMALALGFMDRQSLIDYSNRDEFSCTVKIAKSRVEESVERGLLKGYNPSGAIFNLKNNFKWNDKTEVTVKAQRTELLQESIERHKSTERMALESTENQKIGGD